MKTIVNLIVVTSMFVSQFSLPYASQALAAKSTPTPTATQAPAATATETPTVPPLETIIPIPSETSTPTPSSAEVPPIETVPPLEPIIAVNLDANPGFVTPGGHITIDWKIDGISPTDHELFLKVTLPKGFTPTDKDVIFDEATLTFLIPLLKDHGQFKLQAGQITEDAILSAFLLEKETILTESSLVLATKDQFIVTSQGGEIQNSDGKIKLAFPADTFTGDAVVQIGKPSGDEVPEYSLSGHPISIKAQDKNSKADLHQFDKDIEVEVSYAELNIPEGQEGNLYLYWYNPETKIWEAMLTSRNPETQTLIAITTHFSVFDIGASSWQASRVPTVDAFQVSEFTGAGSYSMPIEVPPGPGGLQPSLGLSYNSQVVDQSTTSTQASWVGMGWSLETGSIERNMNGTTSDEGDDTFFMNVAGVSTRLITDASGAYHPADENFWKITFANNVWTVWDKQGNVYYFETTLNASYPVNCILDQYYQPIEEGSIEHISAQWMLTRTRNIFNQEITYAYQKDYKNLSYKNYIPASHSCSSNKSESVESAIYPSTISYAGGRYRVRFELESRTDYQWENANSTALKQIRRLNNIYVESDQDGNGVFDLIRRYDLAYVDPAISTTNQIYPGYTYTMGGKVTTLEKITQYGTNDTSALPATTFTYGDNLHLTRAENGYGGKVEYSYQPWSYSADAPRSSTTFYNFGHPGNPCRPSDPAPWSAQSGNTIGCENNGGDLNDMLVQGTVQNPTVNFSRPGGVYKLIATFDTLPNTTVKLGLYNGYQNIMTPNAVTSGVPVFITLPAGSKQAYPLIQVSGTTTAIHSFTYQPLPTFYRVSSKTVYSAPGGPSYPYNYSYLDPERNNEDSADVNDAANSATACTYTSPADKLCKAYVETFSEFRGNRVVKVTGPDGKQTTTTFAQNDERKGQTDSVTVRDANGVKIQESIFTADVTSLYMPTYPPSLGNSWGFGHYWVRPNATESRVYALNGTFQATKTFFTFESIYGNLTFQTEKFGSEPNWTIYRTTQTDYALNAALYLVGLPSRQLVMDSGNTPIAETLNIYDANTLYTQAPTVGKLKAVRTWVKGAQTTGDYNQVTYGYDTWGNQSNVTTYSGYGTATTAPSTTGAQVTTTAYDPYYHTYPLTITLPTTPAQTTTLTYNYILGVPETETDPNGAQTRAMYDVFGRMTSLFRPDPVSGAPVSTASLSMAYTDSYPFTTSIILRVDASSTYTVTRVYDGMGRQTKITSGGVSVDTNYFSATETRQSTPYEGGTPPSTFTKTVTDLNARTVTVTAPDNTSTITTTNTIINTNGLESTVQDARGNITRNTTDVWGRTVSVVPPTSPSVTYTYDELNNMLTAERGGAKTSIKYDRAGHKINMDDPDMGFVGTPTDPNWGWTYEYDALGNLTSQVDARGQRICLYYDSLNRLTGKYYPTTNSCDNPTLNVTYTYDVGTNGKGRRTGMIDSSGSTNWAYDKRGRMLSETKTISNVTYATQWGYNLADLMTSTTYPDNEVVTNTYDPRMMLNSVSGTNSYVNSSLYDSAGRITRRIYGTGTTPTVTNYGYYLWNTANQGGRLSTIKSGPFDLNNPNTVTDTLQSLTYSYDAAGNINTILDARNANQKQCFQYDPLDRLTKATTYSDAPQGCTAQAGGGNYNDTYSYNGTTGNLSFKTNAGNLTYGHTAHKHAVSQAGGNYYWYDPNGNMTERSNTIDPSYTFFYDAENRMTQVKQGAVVIATFTYDGDGKRVQSVVNGVNTRFYGVVEIDDHGTQTPPPAPMFTDVPNGYWAKAHIEGVAKPGFVDSCVSSPLQYCPSTNITRLDAIKYIVKTKYGVDYNPPPASHYFVDMAGNTDEAWADQAYRDGITSGCTTTPVRNFCPNNNITRAEIVIFLLKAKHGGSYSPPAATHQFVDMNGHWAEAWADAAYLQGITSGCSTNPRNFCPNSYVSRDMTAVLLNTTFQIASTAFSYSGTWHKYYFAGTSRVAMRTCSSTTCTAPTYFLSDHLGSTSLSLDHEGTMVSTMLYSPWGEVRSGTSATPYQYTGQFSNMSDFGLLFFNARWVDPVIGRFVQADSIVPPGVQGYDRYAYVNNNPLRYTDPSGHCSKDGDDWCNDPKPVPTTFIGPAPYIPHLVGISSGTAPYTTTNYGQQAEETACDKCDELPNGGGAVGAVGPTNDILIGIVNGAALNGKDIPVYANIVTNPDGSTSVPSILVDNKTGQTVSVMQVTFDVSGAGGCDFASTECMTSNQYAYFVVPGPVNYPPKIISGLGVTAPNSMQNISISPSGYPNNPSNTFITSFKITIRLGNSFTGNSFLPISFSFP